MKPYLTILAAIALLLTLSGCPQSSPVETVAEPVETIAVTQASTADPEPTRPAETTAPPETRPANMTDLH